MTTTTASKPAQARPTNKPAPAKPAPAPKKAAENAGKPKALKPEPSTLVEALTTGQCVLIKVRANGTKRSLPYYAEGSDYRGLAQAAGTMKSKGATVEAVADDMKVSLATARRFLTGLALAKDVEAGKFDEAWAPGNKEVVVHAVQPKG